MLTHLLKKAVQGESDIEEPGGAHEVVVCESNSLADRRYHAAVLPDVVASSDPREADDFCGALPPTSATMPHFSIV